MLKRASMFFKRVAACMKFLVSLGVSVVLVGCGTEVRNTQNCTPTGFAMLVRPADPLDVPNHNAMMPGNQELFIAGIGSEVGPGCASTNLYQNAYAQWATSDPKNVTISSAKDATNGLATCHGTTVSGAYVSATLTAYGFTQVHSAPIVCK